MVYKKGTPATHTLVTSMKFASVVLCVLGLAYVANARCCGRESSKEIDKEGQNNEKDNSNNESTEEP